MDVSRLLLKLGVPCLGVVALFGVASLCSLAEGEAEKAPVTYEETILPILEERCYGCHGYGSKKGGIALDKLEENPQAPEHRETWWKVLKNVRAGIMPPEGKPKPTDDEKLALAAWIKRDAFGSDPSQPDPGRSPLRRLNRVEYRNTIRDLMGVDYNTEEEFPPDDTGYGFDTVGDVLTVSPLLLEKYMQAAEAIVKNAVPTVAKVIPEQKFKGTDFREDKGDARGDRLSFYKEATVSRSFKLEHDGDYKLTFDVMVDGNFDFDPGKCTVRGLLDDRELWSESYVWQDSKRFLYKFNENLPAGKHTIAIELHPLTKPEEKKTSVDFRVGTVSVEGPLDEKFWTHPKNYERFFVREEAPASEPDRGTYARELIARFARKAFRRPADEHTLDRLVAIATETYKQPGKKFEEGIARAMVAVLASPRFVFRVEGVTGANDSYPLVDDYALASRLSYFLWGTMPDDELFDLADRGLLRKNLQDQVKRMLADSRSSAMIKNFAGQWLQARDIEGISIEPREILARDNGQEKELQQAREEFRRRLAERKAQPKGDPKARVSAKADREKFFRLFRPTVDLDRPLRQAMRQETEMFFSYVVREDRSVLDLLDSNYTFLNDKLAKFYSVPGVEGSDMRKVDLPEGHIRGGVLTQGTVLVVTSNPTRTSPVKRGQFILDNILGTPAPPPPADIPQLEESEKEFKDHEPTNREVLAVHRAKPLCASCHGRMDPLGLALENFNAMGMYRESERKQPIDASGTLLSGESFHDIRELKHILATQHHLNYYRCLTEKLFTYATGRGPDYYDVETIDQIVERLDREHGKFSALLTGIIESAPFQRRRGVSVASTSKATNRPQAETNEERVSPDPSHDARPSAR